MKRIFERRAGFEAANTVAQENLTKLAAAETALQAQPDSRDKTTALYALYATMGRLGEAQELTARWSGRDALDPDALLARADLAARQGDRERAIRILGGLADVRPGDKVVQTRLADLYEAALNPARACAHRLALADIATTDAKAVAAAVTCARAQGMADLADTIRRDVDDKTRTALDKLVTTTTAAQPATTVRGDVQVSAEWTGGADLDIAIIDAQGKRTSWLGGTNPKVTVTALNATSNAHRVARPPRARLRQLRRRGLARRRSGRDHGRGRQRRRPRRPHHPPPRRRHAQGALHPDRRPRRGGHTPRLLRVSARAGGRVRSRGLERPLSQACCRPPPAAVPPTADGTGP